MAQQIPAYCPDFTGYDLIGRIVAMLIVVTVLWLYRAAMVEHIEAMPKRPEWLQKYGRHYDVPVQVLVLVALALRFFVDGIRFTVCRP